MSRAEPLDGPVIGDNTGTVNISYHIGQLLTHTPPPYRSAVRSMLEYYEDIFGGRDPELAALHAWLLSDHPNALLLAETGRGKTALLIHWIAQVQARGEWTVIFVPVSRRFQTATAEMAFEAWGHALADAHADQERFRTYSMGPAQLRPVIADYLRTPLPSGKRLLIVLDGVDEALGWSLGPDILPTKPPTHLKIMVAARQIANKRRDLWLEEFGWKARQTADILLPTLSKDAIADILVQMGNPLGHLTTEVDVLAHVSGGDPLTVRLIVEALTHQEMTINQLTNLPPGLEAFVEKHWLPELKQHHANTSVFALLGLCATAYAPLTIDDFMALDPSHFSDEFSVEQAAEAVGRFVIGSGSADAGYVFSHPRLRELFAEKVLRRQQAALHHHFVAYGERWWHDRIQPLPPYLRQFWVTHLVAAGQWERIREVVAGIVADGERWIQPWVAARHAAEGSYAGYLSNLALLWDHAERTEEVGLAVRCTLIAATIRSLESQLPPELLAAFMKVGTPEGTWSDVAVLTYLAQKSEQDQVVAMKMLLAAGCQFSADRLVVWMHTLQNPRWFVQGASTVTPYITSAHKQKFLPSVLSTALAISNEWQRADALSALAPHLDAALLPTALTATLALQEKPQRAKALGALAPHLNAIPSSTALAAALALSDERQRADALGALAPHLDAALLPTALTAALALSDERQRADALSALAPHLDAALLPTALTATLALQEKPQRAKALGALAPHLDATLLPTAFHAALALSKEWQRAYALRALAPHLDATLLTVALTAALALSDEEQRAYTLPALAPHLDTTLLPTAFHAALALSDERQRAKALGALAPHLDATLLTVALTAALALSDEEQRAYTLRALAPHLDATLLTVALDDIITLSEEWQRAYALGALAPHLDTTLLTVALTAALALSDEEHQAYALGALAPHLDATLLPTAFHAALALSDERQRAYALGALAPHLDATLLTVALTAALALSDEEQRAYTLRALAPHLDTTLLTVALTAALALSEEGPRADPDERPRADTLRALVPHPGHDSPSSRLHCYPRPCGRG